MNPYWGANSIVYDKICSPMLYLFQSREIGSFILLKIIKNEGDACPRILAMEIATKKNGGALMQILRNAAKNTSHSSAPAYPLFCHLYEGKHSNPGCYQKSEGLSFPAKKQDLSKV